MPDLIKEDMHDLTIYNDLITSLITLKIILDNIDKISIIKDFEISNKIKELEAEKIHELELLQEELRFITLKNRFFGRPSKIKEEIELRAQTKKKTDNIEELKEEVKECELKVLKYYKTYIMKSMMNQLIILKKLIIPKKYLHLVLQAKTKSAYNISKKLQYV